MTAGRGDRAPVHGGPPYDADATEVMRPGAGASGQGTSGPWGAGGSHDITHAVRGDEPTNATQDPGEDAQTGPRTPAIGPGSGPEAEPCHRRL